LRFEKDNKEVKGRWAMKKVVCIIIKLLCFISIILFTAFHFSLRVSKNKDRLKEKYKKYFMLLTSWMDILESNGSLEEYFICKGIDNVAVYGAGGVGEHLLKQLRESNITIKYVIDKSEFLKASETLPLYKPCDDLPEVDAIVVTPVWDYENIREQLLKKVKCPVISLDNVIKGIKNE
jgi:FlaA1/EpsC-like NDP-sugar epimerase